MEVCGLVYSCKPVRYGTPASKLVAARALSLPLLCFNNGFTPDWVFTLQERCPAEEGSLMAASSVFCSWAFAMISEKRDWGVLPWQHQMEPCWIVALCQGLSLRVSRACSLRVNHAYQISMSL